MSYSDITTWRIVDRDGNKLAISDLTLHGAVTIEAREYDPNTSALTALRDAIEDELSDDT